jgi:uncharacterized Zn-binding protein involved in type VI secretion
MPPASRITDLHSCPLHPGGPVASGSPDTIIAYAPAARVTDRVACGGAVDVVRRGASNVLINHLEAARLGDPTVHGGVLATGAPNVIIGETAQSYALVAAAAAANTFVEQCPYAREERELEEAAAAAESQGGAPTTEELPAPPSNLYETTEEERALAASEGDTPAIRVAREKLVREFYEAHAADGLGSARADQDLGVGGVPPRANAHPDGFTIDLGKPVALVQLELGVQVSMSVRTQGLDAGMLERIVTPSPTPRRDATRVIDAASRKHVVLELASEGGAALQFTEGPRIHDATGPSELASAPGEGVRWLLPNTTRESLRCLVCGSPSDDAAPRFVTLAAGKVPPRRCVC